MEELEKFTWYGDQGEPLRFSDLTETERRIARIAAGGLLQGAVKRRKTAPQEALEDPQATEQEN